MENRGIYHNGISAKQFDCTLTLEDGYLHIYLMNETRELLIWDLQALQSCHLNGSFLIVKYGNYPHQTLECSGQIANEVYKAWSGSHVIRKAEGFTFKSKRSSVILFIVLFLGLGIFTLFFFLPWAGGKGGQSCSYRSRGADG